MPRDVPPSLMVQPLGVVDLPPRPLGDQEAEILWGRDRDRLGMCVSQTGGLIAAVKGQ